MFGLLVSSILLAVPAPLSTVAERSGWTETGRYDEVVSLCSAFPRRYPGKVRCERFGTSPEGRPLLALIASADGALEPSKIRKKRRPVLLMQGGIHAGEIDGKDAGFWVLRDLLDGKVGEGVLKKLTLVFVPVFNVDGHERFGPNHRPNQNGPKEMGWRVTAHNLNLNRDYAKAEAPEMSAMLRLLRKYDPIVYADLHVTDGAKFQHDVSVTFEPQEKGPEKLRAHGRALRESLFRELEAQGHLPVGFYPAFEKDDDPSSGFAYGIAPPRFSSAYWTLHNRFGVLVEIHSWKDYPTRVKATRDVVLGLLTRTAADGAAWMAAAQEADRADLSRGGSEVVLRYRNTAKSRPLRFLGYAYTREKSSISGKEWIRYDDQRPQVWEVPYFVELEPAVTATVPREGYLVPPAVAGWLGDKLALHGFSFRRIDRDVRGAEVEVFRAEAAKFDPAPYEGRMRVSVQGAWKPERRDIPAGSLFVPSAQKGSTLLVHLLDPAGPDSFLQWGFFNAFFEQKEYMEDYVAEQVARKMLEDPSLKSEFERRLKEDPAFAKDAAARLRFFYARHPSFDERLNLYPILRLQAPIQPGGE